MDKDKDKDKGFSLIELLVVMVLMGVVSMLAAPGFMGLINQQDATVTANTFLASLHFARSEAVKRGRRVSLCPSADGGTCGVDASYEAGWIVFVGPDQGAQPPYSGEVLRHTPPARVNTTITGNGTMATAISYAPTGQTQGANGALQMGTVTICRQGSGRAVIINRAGRPRVEAISTCPRSIPELG